MNCISIITLKPCSSVSNVARNKQCVSELTSELMGLQKCVQQRVDDMNTQQKSCASNSISWMTDLKNNYKNQKVYLHRFSDYFFLGYGGRDVRTSAFENLH